MERKEPELFRAYPNLKEKLPWIPLLTNLPTPIDRLTNLEEYLDLKGEEIYIKRDDKNHNIYGGNKLRKFEFLFGKKFPKTKPKWLKTQPRGILELDGFCKELKLAFEYMGEQHFKKHIGKCFYIKTEEQYHIQRTRDYLKCVLCKKNGVTLIHINYFEKISKALIIKKLKNSNFGPEHFLGNDSPNNGGK